MRLDHSLFSPNQTHHALTHPNCIHKTIKAFMTSAADVGFFFFPQRWLANSEDFSLLQTAGLKVFALSCSLRATDCYSEVMSCSRVNTADRPICSTVLLIKKFQRLPRVGCDVLFTLINDHREVTRFTHGRLIDNPVYDNSHSEPCNAPTDQVKYRASYLLI